jgi:hypothetical protein
MDGILFTGDVADDVYIVPQSLPHIKGAGKTKSTCRSRAK